MGEVRLKWLSSVGLDRVSITSVIGHAVVLLCTFLRGAAVTPHPFSKMMASGQRGSLILEVLFDNKRYFQSSWIVFFFFFF